MNLLRQWTTELLMLCATREDLYSGCRKIIRNKSITFTLDDSLTMAHSGYTKSKMTMLTKNYLHKESQDMAVQLWDRRREQAKYGSVSFTTFNHFVKGKGTLEEIIEKKSKRASVFGPCIQSVSITWINKLEVAVDIFYRTTEFAKKFPADLVFIRDVLLEPFNFEGMDVSVTCHFANITIHPMYIVTVLPQLKKCDKYFFDWLVKWTARYICPEHHRGIAKFAQALRVHKDANERIQKPMLKILQNYMRDNHPGYKKDYVEPDDDE
jgi:hypothetical protein